jgi:cob(I)alamin adenosyltransferase
MMIQIYTGNGKGKTTAALGLACRSACAGRRVFIGQFLKGTETSELRLQDRFPGLILIEQFGRPCLIGPEGPGPEDIAMAGAGLARIRAVIAEGSWNVIVADEICVAVRTGVVSEEEVLDLGRRCPESLELIFTGRYATPAMIELADLVTEMVEVKHYYSSGKVPAREGIEF